MRRILANTKLVMRALAPLAVTGGALTYMSAVSASSTPAAASSPPPPAAPLPHHASTSKPLKPFAQQWPEAAAELKALLGDRYSTHAGELEVHGTEISGHAAPAPPQCVVWPLSTAEVSAIMKICFKHRVPVVPYAAGTSLEGHTVALQGGLCLDVRQMDRIIKINAADMDVVVQPGVPWMVLNEACEGQRMFLGADPAPGACIGGMCGTGCSGTNAVKYGTMKDQVINLTVVLADGTVLKTGQRARKSSAGYDLARLFVGSEGTLGIVTEATLRMRHVPECVKVATVAFDSVHAAADAVIGILQAGVQLGAIELLDEEMVKCCNLYSNLTLPEKPVVLFKFAGSPGHVDLDIQAVRGIIGKHTTYPYSWTRSDAEVEQLWGARKHAFWAAQTTQPANRKLMSTDVCVPISRLADCIAETKEDLKKSFLYCPIVGHVGDGNFHVCICFDPLNPVEHAEAHRLNNLMVLRAIKMEGTCTGEHGVGTGKKKYLVAERGVGSVELMKTLKRALDPLNILNPGKVIDV